MEATAPYKRTAVRQQSSQTQGTSTLFASYLALPKLDVETTASKIAPWRSTMGGAVTGITLILVGCCLNVITLELITKRDSDSGVLITFAQFAFIAAEGAYNNVTFRPVYGVPLPVLKERVAPLLAYAKLTVIFWLTSVMNNKALAYQISIPVHTVFRSSGLTATLILGFLLYRQVYAIHKVVACALVSAGILTVTLADAAVRQRSKACDGCDGRQLEAFLNQTLNSTDSSSSEFISQEWLFGILMLTAALFLAAFLGHEQEKTFKSYGKESWREQMFYTHLMGLPPFLLVYTQIYTHIQIWYYSTPILINFFYLFQIELSLFFILFLNLFFQLLCIRGVYILTNNTNTLTCTLALTFRKLLSLLLSVAYFNNPFTIYHWLGTALVFAGVLAYSNNPMSMSLQSFMSPTASATSSPLPSPLTSPRQQNADVDNNNGVVNMTSASASIANSGETSNGNEKAELLTSSTVTRRKRQFRVDS